MRGMNSTKGTIFFQLKLVRSAFLIFGGRIVPTLTSSTGKCNDISHTAPSNRKKETCPYGQDPYY
jgi:hypothetical protein